MYPSLGSARFGSVLARAFKEKARLGSARYLFEKARFLKNAQNEPKIRTLDIYEFINLIIEAPRSEDDAFIKCFNIITSFLSVPNGYLR